MRNYWSLLPAIAVIVVLILVYAIPTLINPQWTSSILALFKQIPEDDTSAPAQGSSQGLASDPARQPVAAGTRHGGPSQYSGQVPGQSPYGGQDPSQASYGGQTPGQASYGGQAPEQSPVERAGSEQTGAERAAGVLGPQQVKSRRMLAVALVIGALALVGFNVSLNREFNGCYKAAEAWGAVPGKADEDPCIHKIYGSFFGSADNGIDEENPQPATAYQLVEGKRPKYLKWIQNAPKYDDVDLLIGSPGTCSIDLRVKEEEDKIVVAYDTDTPCPPSDDISLTSVKLEKPLGDRKLVTADDKPLTQINPDADSWPTVLKELVTGG